MRILRKFEEFVQIGTIKKQTPDFSRASSLVRESKERKEFLDLLLKKIKLSGTNANYFVENCYDILIELIRAKMYKGGYSTSGKGAHEAEVSYLFKLGFDESDIRFMNELRYYRNGILYYGKKFDVLYAEKVLKFLEKIFPLLLKLCE